MSHPLLAALRDPDARVRARACQEAASDPSASLLAETLLTALSDRSRQVRRAAGDALVTIARLDPSVSALVERGVRSGSAPQRPALLDVARRLVPPEPGWLPAIVETLAAAPGDARWMAARLLVDLAHRSPETRGVATGLARHDERARVRRMAVLCVAQIDPSAAETVSLLEEATRDPDGEVREAARLALAGEAERAGGLQKTSASNE